MPNPLGTVLAADSHTREMAQDFSATHALAWRWGSSFANILRHGTARMKCAPRRWVEGTGRLAPHQRARPVWRQHIGYRLKEKLRVGMLWIGKERFRFRLLDNTAQIHHGNPVGHVPHDGKVVADEKISQSEFVLKPTH